MSYTYPDKSDQITVQLISKVSRGNYWAESEQHVLDMALREIGTLKKPRRMLDLGCGLGRLFESFSAEVDQILGLEPDEERFQGARQSALMVTNAQCNVMNSDSSVLTDDDIFDVVLSSHVFQHIPLQLCEEMADTIAAHVRPGGLVILTTTHTNHSNDLFTSEALIDGEYISRPVNREEFDTVFQQEGILPVRLFSKETIKDMFRVRGFEMVLCREYHFDGAESVRYDDEVAERTANGEDAESLGIANGRDCMYIFRRN